MYDHLRHLFNAYFHQDWDLDFKKTEEGIKYFAENNPKKTCKGVISDIDNLTSEALSGKRLGNILIRDLGAEYIGIPKEYHKRHQWLRWVRATIMFYMEKKTEQRYGPNGS